MLYVGRNAERRWNERLPASSATCFEADERAPQHDRVPELVDPPAAGPSGELRVLAGRELFVVVAGELRQLLDHDRPSRHVDPDGEGLGGEHDLDEPLDEARFDDFLERRHHAGVVGREPGIELGEELAVAEHREIGRVERAEAGIGDLPDAARARPRW